MDARPNAAVRDGAGLLVVVPTFNERQTLATLIEQLHRTVPRAEALIVDDASPDGTGELAEQLADRGGVHVLHRHTKLGLGSAYRAGFAWCLQQGQHRAVAAMDADLSHDPSVLPDLLAALDRADLVIGSRYVPGGAVGSWSPTRRLLSRSANRYVRGLTGLPVRDATSGYRVYRREVLACVAVERLRSEGYAFQIEAVLQAHRSGFRTAEVPIEFHERRAGRSKLSRRVVVEAAWRVPLWAASGRRRAPAPHPESIAATAATA